MKDNMTHEEWLTAPDVYCKRCKGEHHPPACPSARGGAARKEKLREMGLA